MGTLDDLSSQFILACRGTDACATSAADCAENEWRDLGEVSLAASFFLPPEGLPASPASDSELIVIGRTSDPPAIVVGEFTQTASSAAGVVAGGCSLGAACTVAVVGDCEDVSGEIVETDDGCGCRLDDIPAGCIACGSGASGACGGACEFAVAGATARGSCLPFTATTSECACFANDAAGDSSVEGCGSVLDAACPGQRCCADDPRDGCSTAAGDYDCAGVCVVADCDGAGSCGICEPGGAFCGDGILSEGEECDGANLGGESCTSLGFIGGELACGPSCTFDESDCIPCRETGASCDGDAECCEGECTRGVCSEPATPTPSPTDTPAVTPTPSPTAVPTPTPPLPCQAQPGGVCLGSGFGDCCDGLQCVFGPGNSMVCSQISECGNEIVEPGEECEDSSDCPVAVGSPICINCECFTGTPPS
jgi:hypothetical protein